MKKYSKEEKKEYFDNLRLEWKKSKALAENDMQAEALFRESGLTGVSYFGFYFVLKQMQKLKLKGLPYVDCKTLGGWRQNGYKVIKGEHSKVRGIIWMKAGLKKGEKKVEEDMSDGYVPMYPKIYHLFHKSQVEEM